MAEEKSLKEKEPSLEDRLLDIGSINLTAHGIRTQKDEELRSEHYLRLAKQLFPTNPEKERTAHLNMVQGDVGEALRYANDNISAKVNDIKELYEKGKEPIKSKVISMIEEELKTIKDKAEAASILGQYLTGAFKLKELDQYTADLLTAQEMEAESGIHMIHNARGRIDKYQDKYANLQTRIIASKYLKDKTDKEGKVIGYELDKGELSKIMDDVKMGAMLYTNASFYKELVEAKKAEAEEAKKK